MPLRPWWRLRPSCGWAIPWSLTQQCTLPLTKDSLHLAHSSHLFFCSKHYGIRVLCRVLHSAKSCRHIPSRQRLLCRVPHVGHSAKDFPSATTALGKEKPLWRPGHGDGPFAECHASALGKEMCFLFFFKKCFAECLHLALGKACFLFFWIFFAECCR